MGSWRVGLEPQSDVTRMRLLLLNNYNVWNTDKVIPLPLPD